MSNDDLQARDEPVAWCFGEFELDGVRRRLTRAGSPVRLSTRAFDVLRHLARRHPRVVSRAELLAHCWPQRDVTDGAVARVVMSLRIALGGVDPQHGPIRTTPRAGYRLALPVRVRLGRPATGAAFPARVPEAPSTTAVRLAVLPVDNRSADPQLGWVALGMASLLGAHLAQRQVEGLATPRQVLSALKPLSSASRADPSRCARAVAQSLGARAVLATRLSVPQGRCMLHLALHADGAVVQQGTVLADAVAGAAQAAADLVARWLERSEPTLGDAFLDEAWLRARRCCDDDNLLEAEHLLEVLRDAAVDAPAIDLEHARTAWRLGRPWAVEVLQRIEARVAQGGDPRLRVEVLLLQALHLDRQGRGAQALPVLREATELARYVGEPELQARATVACALQIVAARAEGAREMLAQLLPHVETCGNRILMRDACVALGQAAVIEQDWAAALRHQALGLAVSETLHDSAQAMASKNDATEPGLS